MNVLQRVSRVAEKIAPGRSPSFAEAHVIKAIEEIALHGDVGRMKLSRDLELGEGETRTLIKHLKSEGLIEVSKSGIALSPSGRKVLSGLRALVSEAIEIPSTPLTVGPSNIAVRVKGGEGFIKYGLEQRDAAMMAGAKGATTLVFAKGRLTMAGTIEDVSKNYPQILSSLSKIGLDEGDVVIIGSADEMIKAELGAKTAALELFKLKP